MGIQMETKLLWNILKNVVHNWHLFVMCNFQRPLWKMFCTIVWQVNPLCFAICGLSTLIILLSKLIFFHLKKIEHDAEKLDKAKAIQKGKDQLFVQWKCKKLLSLLSPLNSTNLIALNCHKHVQLYDAWSRLGVRTITCLHRSISTETFKTINI